MSDFVWIISAEKNTSFGEKGVSGSYIIPKEDMKIPPESLAGKRLWVILRDNDDRIFLSLKNKKIEKIIEGYYAEDYLVSIDLLASFRMVAKYHEAINYITKSTSTLGIGVSEINQGIVSLFSQMVRQNIEVKLAKPNQKLISNANIEILPKSGQSLAKSALRIVTSCLNLNDIWAEGTGKKLSAFPNFASAIIKNNVSPETATDVADFLKSFDPINSLSEKSRTQDVAPTGKIILSPQVDIDFTVLEPEKIYTREFVSSGNKFKDLETALRKTEHAEKIHQEMLKDIAKFLISKGIIPYESSSIDLMFRSKNKIKICEIKSTNLDNLLAQSSKGAFQLTCYIEKLIDTYDNIAPQLILRKTGNEEMESYIEKILSRMNVPVLYYDPNKSWPHRMSCLFI